MKRWRVWFLLTLASCFPILHYHRTGASLLADTDTAYLLKVIRARHSPLSWFTGDWPLKNHFYRPLPTLTFELDNRLYGNWPGGYGWTNAILCVLCVLALFWVLYELSESGLWAFAGAGLFALWNVDDGYLLGQPLIWAAVAVVLVGFWRHGLAGRRYIPAALVLCFVGWELAAPEMGGHSFDGTMIAWLPGRTASVMTLFTLTAMAAYIRYERARNRLMGLPPATATDRPTATRSGSAPIPKYASIWLSLSVLCTLAAFASYEQAVMLPAILLGTAVMLRLRRRLPDWRIHAVFWIILAAYLVFRHVIIPAGPSHYQLQQFRHGPGVYEDLFGYLVPNLSNVLYLWTGLTTSIWAIFTVDFYGSLLGLLSTATMAYEARRNWQLILSGWALSALAFLPMAWLKPFGHYHYWPMALRTLFVLGVAKVAWDLLSTAVCPPVLQAPPRPSPAPGSLPRP